MKHDLAKKLRREQTQVERKLWLALHGFRVLRFPNHQLNDNYDGVLTGIAIALGLPS